MQGLLALLLFPPAGTFRYWQGWGFWSVSFLFPLLLAILFYKRDPQLLERRLLRKETVPEQKRLIHLGKFLSLPAYLLPGFDQRLGWSRKWTGPVPGWLTLLALLGILGTYILLLWVMNTNRFAASVIQVEAGQRVITDGPYRLVRHPMYLGFVAAWLLTPLALGSFVTTPAFLPLIPLLIFRLLNEEKILRRELASYPEYCARTRHRLIPFVW